MDNDNTTCKSPGLYCCSMAQDECYSFDRVHCFVAHGLPLPSLVPGAAGQTLLGPGLAMQADFVAAGCKGSGRETQCL
eukprot:11357497-Karenia_brevis.AAC.1